MKHSPSEIINALKVIKETCEEASLCTKCPLSVGDIHRCGIRYSKNGEKIMPEQWEVVNETPKSLFLH